MQDYVNLMAQACKLRQGNYKFKVCLHQSEFKPSLCNLTRICKKKDIKKKSGIQQRMHEPWVQSCTLKKEVIWLKQTGGIWLSLGQMRQEMYVFMSLMKTSVNQKHKSQHVVLQWSINSPLRLPQSFLFIIIYE